VLIRRPTFSPVQQTANLERDWGVKLLDRTGLDLEIFADPRPHPRRRVAGRTRGPQLQRPRLVRCPWTHLERQRAALALSVGPQARRRSNRPPRHRRPDDPACGRQLKRWPRTRELHRAARRQVPFPGGGPGRLYTPANRPLFKPFEPGLMCCQGHAFATLDPRCARGAGRPALRSSCPDTVGFISDLPTQLCRGFRATLEEVLEGRSDLPCAANIAHCGERAQARGCANSS